MSVLRPDQQPLVLSVLDRLIDMEPGGVKERPKSRAETLRELKFNVRRDLENLLNTKHRCQSPPPGLDELTESLVNYGIPDFTGVRLSAAREREQFRRTMEEIIRRYEPRFKNVRVTLIDRSDSLERTLHFRIDAVLVNPVSEAITFDTALEPTSGDFEIKRVS